MLRFSHCVVSVGQVPSTGNALTGSRSPLLASMMAVTRCTKSGAFGDTIGGRCLRGAHRGRHRHLVQVGQRPVDGGVVLLDHVLAALAVGLLDRVLDLRDRLLAGQDARDREEAGLHDRVDARAHAGGLGHLVGVDHVELQLLLDDLLLHLAGQVVPHLVGGERRVQQEHRARPGIGEHVVLLEEGELVAGHEAGALHQVRRADRPRAEAQVGDRDGARLLRVVHEVALP